MSEKRRLSPSRRSRLRCLARQVFKVVEGKHGGSTEFSIKMTCSVRRSSVKVSFRREFKVGWSEGSG